jgi:[acyl-carrier-protein] S-malonyltransferase
MLAELAGVYPLVKQTFEEASDTLHYDLWKLAQHGPEEELNKTEHTQPAMLAAGVAVSRVWQAQGGIGAQVCAGHSLGEYSALVHAGALTFRQAAPLVAARGRFMQEAVPPGIGAMAAILGLEDEQVQQVCAAAARQQVVSAANYNAPGQVVVAGHADAVGRAVEGAKQAGAKRALLLSVSVPSHCALMQPAEARLRERLQDAELQTPALEVLHNVDANPRSEAAAIAQALGEQLHQPVRWVKTVRSMAEQGIQTIIELGPGKVLAGLNKRIAGNLRHLSVMDSKTLDQALASAAEAAVCN